MLWLAIVMPMHKGLLPREGFTSDALGPILKGTLFNPLLTIPLVLLGRYTKRGFDLSILHEKAFKRLKILMYLGIIRYINNYLSHGALDNWVADKYDWDKEIVVVTGGAGGIGGEIVKLFEEKGVTVVVLDVIPMTFETGPKVHYFKCDITSSSRIAEVGKEIRQTVGAPTVLINNAGVARGKTILDSTEKDVRFTFDVNTIAHYLLAKEFVPSMVERNHGTVVTVASLAAYLAAPNMVDYAASKAAAVAFHEGLASELRTKYNAPKVRTVLINQSYTKTALFQGFHNDSTFLMPTLEVESVAEGIVRQVLSGKSGQLVMPGFGVTLTGFRGFPHWYQIRTRNAGQILMSKWHGRQVIDVENEYKIKDGRGNKEQDSSGESA